MSNAEATAALLLPMTGPIKPPTREELLSAPFHFGGQTVTLNTYGTIPWFDVALFSLNAEDRQRVYQMKRAAGDRFVTAALWWAYRSGDGYIYPVSDGLGVNYANNWSGFKALIQEAINENFFVDVKLACEGQRTVDGQLGYAWGQANVPALMTYLQMGTDVTPWCVMSYGFELFGPGGDWSDQQVTDAHLALRRALPNGVIGVEFGQGYNKWNAGQVDPDDGPACWATEAGQAIDVFMQEFPQPIFQDAYTYGPTDHWFGCQILGASDLGPAYIGDRSHFSHPIPWYFATGTPRGPHHVWAYEYALFDWVRKNITYVDYAGQRNALQLLGYSNVG